MKAHRHQRMGEIHQTARQLHFSPEHAEGAAAFDARGLVELLRRAPVSLAQRGRCRTARPHVGQRHAAER